jgi:DNA-binding response OmpR family regulator
LKISKRQRFSPSVLWQSETGKPKRTGKPGQSPVWRPSNSTTPQISPTGADALDRRFPPEPTSLPTTDTRVILLVDDTPSNLQVLFTGLERSGFKVLVAQNGANALRIAESQLPDLILFDILMPGFDGFETCCQLKARASTREIPVIFLTALSETRNKVRGLEVGGVDYVTKPIDRDELLARIHIHLKLQTVQQHLVSNNQALQREIQVRQQIELQLQERQQQLQKAIDFKASVERITEQIRDSLDERQILQTATEELFDILPALKERGFQRLLFRFPLSLS